MTIAAAMLVFGLAAAGAPGAYGPIETIGGPADCAAATGNGSLTVGVDAAGTVSVCRWPGTTAPNQIVIDGTGPAGPGVFWAVPGANGLESLAQRNGAAGRVGLAPGAAPIIETVYEAIGATETVFVCPESDVAAFRLQFAIEAPESVVWYADFSPCTAPLRGFPSSERYFPARRDMLAFVADSTVYHVRAANAGGAVWDDADRWIGDGTEPRWFKTGSGVWIGYAAAWGNTGAVCGPEQGPTSARQLAQGGAWGQQVKAVGACASAVRVPVDADKSAVVFVALGERRADVDGALDTVRKLQYGAALDETRKWWTDKLAAAPRPNGAPEAVLALHDRALRTLLLSADRESGAVARAPNARPPLAVDVPSLGAWTTLALDLANETGAAGRHLQNYASTVRGADAPGAPAGSLPFALYGTGEDAAPQVVLDVTASAWFLWSAWEHDARVAEGERDRYRSATWKAVELAGDFLANECRAARDTPVFSFDPARLSDSASIETIALACAGIRAANAFAHAMGKEEPDWAARAVELEDVLRSRVLDAAGNFKTEDPIALWPAGLVPADDDRWEAPVQDAAKRIETAAFPDSLETLAGLCILLRDQPQRHAALQALAAPVVARALDAYPCDSYCAALTVVIIQTAFSGERP